MLVQFVSSETGEVLMYADVAKVLLQAMGKECTARGAFLPEQMLPAAQALREAVKRSEAQQPVEDEDEEDGKKKEVVVGLRQRAWPLIDMLERTAKAGREANIVWEAAADFH
jgi:hypothetical protein